ncbi:hypothetical protein VNO77_35494 [Canavalia gladiata]|uniref:PWWP domain-containing protein n=1 Tax=Canavalia gladiata TaxID=3824 RepID=A0AAN9KHC8_CANGL
MSGSDSMVQGFEQEKKELREGLGGLRNEDGFSSLGNQGLGDYGAAEVVKSSSVLESKVAVLRENDCHVLVDSEMNGVSSLSKMQESGISTVFSSDDAEKLECDFASGSESKIAEAAVLSLDGSVRVGGEDGGDGVKSEEEEKNEDCDANVVTIEVPIAEASENMDVEMEDLSDEGFGYAVGDYVWGKIKNHSWWPGQVYDPSDASHLALKLKQKNRLLVAYFGDSNFAWCHPSQLKPFEENFDGLVKQSGSIAFVNAVQEAVNEVGRHVFLKMSHPFVAKKTLPEFPAPLVKNSGIKEGVHVPENDIEGFFGVPVGPAELLSQVKQIAEIIDIASILELEILKAQLSAFYLSKGGYKLPDYMDPQPIPGFEDSRMNEKVDVGNSKSAVEPPLPGPFEEDYSTLSVNGPNPRRKQKSIAEIMGDDIDVLVKNKEGDATGQMMDATESSDGKKTKGSEDAMTSKPVQKKRESRLDTDRGENEDRKEKGSLSRERKKSKYLSPPFTTSIWGLMNENIEPESVKVSSKAKASQGMTTGAGQLSPLGLKYNDVAFQENLSEEAAMRWGLFDSSNYQTHKDDEKKTIDPKKIQAPVGEVLFQVLSAAICPLIPRENTSLDQFVDFVSVFRSSLYCQGSLHKVYKKQPPGRKRKKAECDHGMLRKDQSQSDHISPNQDSLPTKRRKETVPGKPKVKRAPETVTEKKGTDENDLGAVLFVSFWPGSSLPFKSDLIRVYGEFGALNEAETDMFRTNYTARVSFLRTCDAEKALNHSQNNNPFGSSDVTFELQYLSDGSKSAQHGERSKSKGKIPATPSAPLSQGSEASKLIFIKQKLQGLTSILEASGGKSPDMITKLEREMKALLEDVNKMVESSLS